MKATIKYFGMIADKVKCEEETLEVNLENYNNNLRDFFEERHPEIKKTNYKIAVNQEFTDTIEETNESVEIALLPPFAGG